MKILLFSNTDWFMLNFNSRLISRLLDLGHEVLVAVPEGPYVRSIENLGCRVISTPFSRSSLNPIKEIRFILWFSTILRKNKPDIIHNFTLKCVIWGSIASIVAGVRCRVNELTGLGHVFTSNRVKARIIRFIVYPLLRIAFSTSFSHLVLLNKHDYNYFKSLHWLRNCRIHLVLGAGVDCKKFSQETLSTNHCFRVLLPARMLWDKGVGEFVEAAIHLKGQKIDAEFILAGNIDFGNPTSIPENKLKQWVTGGAVKWLGHVDDMSHLYSSVNLVVLPSYREGLPNSLTEGAACGLPLIATNVPGCADVVSHDYNGFLIPVGDHISLAKAILWLYNDRELCKRFGNNSRRLALEKFSDEIILAQRISIYSSQCVLS